MRNYQTYLERLKGVLKKFLKYIIILVNKPEKNNQRFEYLIQKRHKKFWKARNAERVRNTMMNASDPIEKWKDVKNWQRKLSNKYNAREFALKHDCKVAKLYWKGRDYNNIDFDKLPENYVIKPTVGHSCGLVFLMKNSCNLMDKKTYSPEKIKEVMATALHENQDTVFLIEEFVRTEDGEHKIPDDYKFYMFAGQIGCIQVINRLNCSQGFTSWYDENWNSISNLTTNYSDGEVQLPPKCLPEMIETAGRLSKSYKIFCRIDFYATDQGAVFGEFTPTPALGKNFTPLGDKLLADYWDKFCKGMI